MDMASVAWTADALTGRARVAPGATGVEDTIVLRPLRGCSVALSRRVSTIRVEVDGAEAFRMEATENSGVQRKYVIALAGIADFAFVKESVIDLERSSAVDELATPEDCRGVIRTIIKLDGFVFEVLASSLHEHIPSVGCGDSTVAEAGGASSAPGGGAEA